MYDCIWTRQALGMGIREIEGIGRCDSQWGRSGDPPIAVQNLPNPLVGAPDTRGNAMNKINNE